MIGVKKRVLTLAIVLFMALGLTGFHLFLEGKSNKSFLENSTNVKFIAENPEKYQKKPVQVYGKYTIFADVNSPTNYTLESENSSIPITKCERPEKLGEEVFLKGIVLKIEFEGENQTKLSKNREILKNRNQSRYDELHEDVKTNKTAYIIECGQILN